MIAMLVPVMALPRRDLIHFSTLCWPSPALSLRCVTAVVRMLIIVLYPMSVLSATTALCVIHWLAWLRSLEQSSGSLETALLLISTAQLGHILTMHQPLTTKTTALGACTISSNLHSPEATRFIHAIPHHTGKRIANGSRTGCERVANGTP